MRVILALSERAIDLTPHPVGAALAALASGLRALGDDDATIIDAVETACDAVDHPLLLDRAMLDGDTLILHVDDPDTEAATGEAWLQQG